MNSSHSNVEYSFVDQTHDSGNIVFRSHVKSFGLDHVTDKDLISFYHSFSSLAYFDTGLLPVDGTGLLSIRSAGNHTQVAYQHKPGMYYINWGTYEGDSNAKKYYVAQPYRIIIGDFLDGNIYGARTFYSPYPITHPDTPLYHVNLPNINCRGYRGNGVGWICLYHTEDLSSYPFNEKVAKLVDRCSGTEAYNDNNMSETDGPRFYRSYNKPAYTWDPQNWENYSNTNGYEWTLDENQWIPVLVQDMDNQDKHYEGGQTLTFADAILGNYKAHYYDNLIPKPVNAILRGSLQHNSIFNWFKLSYNSSQTYYSPKNSFSDSLKVRDSQSQAPPVFVSNDDDDDELDYSWFCTDCEEGFTDSDPSPNIVVNSAYVCDHCYDNYVYCVNKDTLYHQEDEVLYLDRSDCYIYLDHASDDEYSYCICCQAGFYKTHPDFGFQILHDDGCSICNPLSGDV